MNYINQAIQALCQDYQYSTLDRAWNTILLFILIVQEVQMKKKALLVIFVLALVLVMATPAFAGPPAGAGHQAIAAELKGGVAELMPGHVANAHQAAAADLKGGVADLVPEHVRP